MAEKPSVEEPATTPTATVAEPTMELDTDAAATTTTTAADPAPPPESAARAKRQDANA